MHFAIKTAPQNTTYRAMLDVWRVADLYLQRPHTPEHRTAVAEALAGLA